jgi:AcrR family transcriptional regulator
VIAAGWEAYLSTLPLRERKKARTKLAIQEQALRMFGERGYESTTIDDIAEAAEVAPRTVFRYFATKDELVLWDVMDETKLDNFIRGEPGEPPILILVRGMCEVLSMLEAAEDRDSLLARLRLVVENPSLLSAARAHMLSQVDLLADLLAARTGTTEDLSELRVAVGAIFGAFWQAGLEWARANGEMTYGGRKVTTPFGYDVIFGRLADQFAAAADMLNARTS